MKNIIFVAAPAAGKGTISAKVCTEYNIPHISTGDLLRNEIASSSKIGMEIKSAMVRGEFVSDEVITKLLKKRLEAKDCKKGFILDGYPRNISQAKTYDNILKELNYDEGLVVFLDIDRELAMKRALSRVVCSKCGLSYNLINKEYAPLKEGICDNCGSSLKTRSDDNEESFINRFDTFMKETYPLLEYYEKKGNLLKIKVDNITTDDIFDEIKKVIK
jgi:adenylate kinase